MRPLIAHIRLNHLRENYLTLKKMQKKKLLAVVKANAYGHGAVACANALADIADGFAVATIEEALELRQADIQKPIVLLEGVFEVAEYALIDQHQLWPVVQTQWQLDALLEYPWQQPVSVWLKMDSGMHRAGFFPQDYHQAYQQLFHSSKVKQIVKMTHFACADEFEKSLTDLQMQTFNQGVQDLVGDESIANSAAILLRPDTLRDWARAGLALYGISPMGGVDPRLKPVMQLTSKVFSERYVTEGTVGYGALFSVEKPIKLGLIACGYADGYPRYATTDTPILINGLRSRLIGRISMDMLVAELKDNQGVGSEVELWGDHLNINEVAQAAETIPYEILCNVKRAKFIYSK